MEKLKQIIPLLLILVVVFVIYLQHFVVRSFDIIVSSCVISSIFLLFISIMLVYRTIKKSSALILQKNKEIERAHLELTVRLKQVESGEMALKRSEAQFRALAEESSQGIAVIQKGFVRFANDALASICGYSVNEILSWEQGGFARVISSNDLPRIMEHNAMMESGMYGGVEQSTVSIIAKSGEKKNLRYFARTIDWHNGSANFLSFVDISASIDFEERIRIEREKLEVSLQQRTEELERANREMESFAYSVSHDLRAPLRAVVGFAQAMEKDFGASMQKECRNYLQRLTESADYMNRLIVAFLDLSKVTRNDMVRYRTDLSRMANGIITSIRQDSTERKCIVTIDENMIELVDPSLFSIVLTNLFGNAWKYTSKRNDATISFTLSTRNGESVYCVSDNGVGFDMRYAARLFTPFQRLHSASDFEGLGVGLAIANKIVTRHGGRMWFFSEPDKGAAFFFTIGSMKDNL